MNRPLSWVARTLEGDVASDAEVRNWSVDTRTLADASLFFALKGPNHDGHNHVATAFSKGAVAAVVEYDVPGTGPLVAGPLIKVDNALEALQTLASQARLEWGGDVIALTGSAGKTTSKEIIAAMLAVAMPVEKTQGNLNNHIGLPLSLLRLDESARVAVLEMGMNHAGEIRTLAQIARPSVGLVTNVSWAHVENFDGIDGIAAAKRELIEELGPQGTAVLNADDPVVAKFADVHPGRTILYGESPKADVRVEDVVATSDGLRFRVGKVSFESSLTGRHYLLNIAAALSISFLYGLAPEKLQDCVRSLRPASMRGERLTHDGITIFNDCYNSNPGAVRAMLDVLRDTPARRRIAVLGEMLELGAWAERLHGDIGTYAASSGVDVLVGIRGEAQAMLVAAMRAGLSTSACHFFETANEAGEFVRSIAAEGDAILFKGSRGVHVETALEALLGTVPTGGVH
jgi:UDP-N-acetylmuramoyl-tripeptide--D-alanyl-D-alanine ligase